MVLVMMAGTLWLAYALLYDPGRSRTLGDPYGEGARALTIALHYC